jgi:hypothetical protein
MLKFRNRSKNIILVMVVVLFLAGSFAPLSQGLSVDSYKGFDKGPSYTNVVPMKKVTFVNFDENSYLDDYAYLASVPTCVFEDDGKLYSNPLLFYQDKYDYEDDKERSFDARQGIDYFMDDWMSYSNGKLDQMTLINVPKTKLNSNWESKKYISMDGEDPYNIANKIALNDWSNSDNAIIAVIQDEFEVNNEEFIGNIKGTFESDKEIKTEHFEVKQTNKLNPISNEFDVPEGYSYLHARVWYPCKTMQVGIPFVTFFDNLANISIPSGDKDLQLYCKYDGDWMQVLAFDEWNQKFGMDNEKGGTYIHTSGRWRATVTDVPTKGSFEYGSFLDRLKNMLQVVYQVDITMYPGERIKFLQDIPFDCKNVSIELKTGNKNSNIGFCLIGPGGEEIKSDTNGKIELDELGQCLLGESYDLVLYGMDDKQGSFDYTIEYRFSQGKTRFESDCLSAATQGAVLASTLNSPMLYVTPDEISDQTIDTINKLGVNKIYLINIGEHISEEVYLQLDKNSEEIIEYKTEIDVYDAIRSETGSNDIVFSTIDSWIPWYATEMEPTDEIDMPFALHIGPAAYLAAHHGTPVILVDNTPELSSSVVWHNEFWKEVAKSPEVPTVANMYLTGKRIWDYLKTLNFDEIGLESIITIAGQYNIGVTWDRIFNGIATPGRFIGTPVDVSYWINRDMFYPALIFVNPATDPDGVMMNQGSHSTRRTLFPWTPLGLKITKPETVEKITYPVHFTFVHYEHRFNERASKYWGYTYQCADGLTPGEDYTMNPIDQGVSMTYLGEEGSLFPDMSMTDVIPAYLEKGGYGGAYSTSFDKTLENVNNGVLLWVHLAHGGHINGGCTQFWYNKREPNPWRMYEAWLGSTEEPDTMSLEIHGIIPMILGNPDMNGLFRSAMDFAPAKMPLRDLLGKIASLPLLRLIAPDWFEDTEDYYDGMINTALFSQIGTKWYGGVEFDDATENLHSAGFIANSCLMGTKYLHLSMIRHGSSYQIIDPWSTSWYSAVWVQSIPRDIILGDTMGEAFNKGISHVGILYLGGGGASGKDPQWWWDNHENVIYFGDPDLRMFVPSTEYSENNHWEKEDTLPIKYDAETNINGHMPFGATSYPNAHEKQELFFGLPLFIVIILVLIVILVLAVALIGKKK